jgi:hypothetical protein
VSAIPSATGAATSPALGTPAELARERFAGRIDAPLPMPLRREMRGRTWRPDCPVPMSDLALLRFNYVGFDGGVKRGPMVVNASVALDVLGVFRALFEAGFPIKHVALARPFDPEDQRDTTRSITSSFNCRPIVTADGFGESWSQHAYGLAVDVNPLLNPYVATDGSTLRPAAEAYVDRSQDLPGMIHEGDLVVRAFAAIGWGWGGRWTSIRDYQHFSLSGR